MGITQHKCRANFMRAIRDIIPIAYRHFLFTHGNHAHMSCYSDVSWTSESSIFAFSVVTVNRYSFLRPMDVLTNFDVQLYISRPYCVVSIGGIVVIVRMIDFIKRRHQDDSKPDHGDWRVTNAIAGRRAGLLPLP